MRLTLRIALIATVVVLAGLRVAKRATDTPVGLRVALPGWPPMTATACEGEHDGIQSARCLSRY